MTFRFLALGLLLFFTACASSSKSAAVPSKLSEAQLARIDAAYAALEKAFDAWNLNSFGQDCVLLFDEREQWLIGCTGLQDSKDFQPTGQSWRGQPVLWHEKSFYVSGRHTPYEQVKMGLVGTVGSQNSGSSPVLMLQDWPALSKNHPAFAGSALEEWLAIFVHEAFHARQMWHPKIRSMMSTWNSGNIAGPEDLMGFYKANPGFQAAIKKEYDLLRSAIDQDVRDPKKVKAVLAEWLGLYRRRQKNFGPLMEKALPGKNSAKADKFLTFIEGTARYVEAGYLINPAALPAGLQGDPTFKNFAATRGKKPSELPGLGNIGPKYFYALGMYLSFLLDRVDESWKLKVFNHEDLLVRQVEVLSL